MGILLNRLKSALNKINKINKLNKDEMPKEHKSAEDNTKSKTNPLKKENLKSKVNWLVKRLTKELKKAGSFRLLKSTNLKKSQDSLVHLKKMDSADKKEYQKFSQKASIVSATPLPAMDKLFREKGIAYVAQQHSPYRKYNSKNRSSNMRSAENDMLNSNEKTAKIISKYEQFVKSVRDLETALSMKESEKGFSNKNAKESIHSIKSVLNDSMLKGKADLHLELVDQMKKDMTNVSLNSKVLSTPELKRDAKAEPTNFKSLLLEKDNLTPKFDSSIDGILTKVEDITKDVTDKAQNKVKEKDSISKERISLKEKDPISKERISLKEKDPITKERISIKEKESISKERISFNELASIDRKPIALTRAKRKELTKTMDFGMLCY